MEPTLLIHVVAGTVGLLCGFAALYSVKGAMLYWLWNVRVRRSLRGILPVRAPDAVVS